MLDRMASPLIPMDELPKPDPYDFVPKESDRFGTEPRNPDAWYVPPRPYGEAERDSSGGLKDAPSAQGQAAPGNESPWADLTRGR